MSGLVLVALAGGGLVAVQALTDEKPSQKPTSNPNPSGSNPGSTAGKGKLGKPLALVNMKTPLNVGVAKSTTVKTANQANGGWGTKIGAAFAGVSGGTPGTIERAKEEIRRKAEQKIKEEYDKLSKEAKKRGAEELNKQLKLDPPLTGDESWGDISKIVGGVAGAAVGTYVCGPICGKLGAIAGAYLGDKMSKYIEENWDDVKDWAEENWDDAVDEIGDLASDAYNTVKFW